MISCIFRNEVTCSYIGQLIPAVLFFTAAIAGQMNYKLVHQKLDQMIFQQPEYSICTKKYWYPSYINTGVTLRPWIPLLWKNDKIWIPRKNRKPPQNTNMFFQPMSDFYTLVKGDCWNILDLTLWNLVRFLSFRLSGTGKCLCSESGQISVKRGNIF